MDELDTPAGDEASGPAKKTRKSAGRRPRGGAVVDPVAEAISSVQAALGTSSPETPAKPKRGRPRRGKAAGGEGQESPAEASAPELFPSGSDAPFVVSFSPDDPSPAETSAPPAQATRDEPPAPEAREERPIFVPNAGESDPQPSAAADDAGESAPGGEAPAASPSAPGSAGDHAAGGQRRTEERKSWWERKKEKKRQKWLERQQAGGHAGGGHPAPHTGGGGPHGGAHAHHSGGGGGGDRGRDRGERIPAQPAPPSLQGPVGGLPDAARFADPAALDAMAEELAKDSGPLDLAALHEAPAGELSQRLRALGETIAGMPPRRVLLEQLFAWAAREKRAFRETGLLDLTDAGHGFVVHRCNSYRLHLDSTFVPPALVKRHGLRRGQEIEILVQPPQPGERCPAAVRVLSVMGTTPEAARDVTAFEELIPYYPTSRILVEAPEIHKDISMRAVDLLTPIGFGQRGLIVAPPRTGKTVLLQNIANSISHNFPEATLILLLIDERPEEVTDFKRHTKGEVVSSTFDEAPESHVHAAEMVIERARRLVELGKHVIILLDSITRLARAYNALAGNGGKTMSGGLESNALQRPKRFFGSARNIEGGGSLTILATALVDTNSRMDEVIFEEFKGTGNMELHLDRGLSDKRIFPAINIDRSGTRKEELIYHPDEMLRVYGLRRAMQGIPPVEAMDMFIQRLKKTRTNTEFLLSLNR